MSRQDRLRVVALLVGAVLVAVVLGLFASQACPVSTDANPCESATVNQAVVVGLAAVCVGMAVTAFAWLAEFRRRRIAYLGSWTRAGRRGALAAAVVAALAGLRLGDALNILSALVVIGLAAAAEWAIGRADQK